MAASAMWQEKKNIERDRERERDSYFSIRGDYCSSFIV